MLWNITAFHFLGGKGPTRPSRAPEILPRLYPSHLIQLTSFLSSRTLDGEVTVGLCDSGNCRLSLASPVGGPVKNPFPPRGRHHLSPVNERSPSVGFGVLKSDCFVCFRRVAGAVSSPLTSCPPKLHPYPQKSPLTSPLLLPFEFPPSMPGIRDLNAGTLRGQV